MPVIETKPPTSPPSQQSQFPIDLDSPLRDATPTQSHTLGIQRPHIPPSSEASRDSIWLEGFLGRKRERPSYELGFTEFDHVPQDMPAKKLKKQVHVERNAGCELIMETAAPPEDKSIHEVQVEDFTLSKFNLGKTTRQVEANLLEITSVSAQERKAKDGKDKAAFKAENQQLRSYISSLMHGTPNVSTLPPELLDLSAEQNHQQLITYGKHLRDQVEEFVLKGRCILANLYQL